MSASWAKTHARIIVDDEDSIIQDQYLVSARELVEQDTGLLFMKQTRVLYLDDFPHVIHISKNPVRSIVSIKYLDQDEVEQTFNLARFVTDPHGEYFRLTLDDDETFPITEDAPGAVRIEYRCGYATEFTANDTTDTLTAVSHDFENGDAIRIAVYGGHLPNTLDAGIYYVINKTDDTFQIATTPGGSAVSPGHDGQGTFLAINAEGSSIFTSMIQAMSLAFSTMYEHRESETDIDVRAYSHSYDAIVDRLSRVMF